MVLAAAAVVFGAAGISLFFLHSASGGCNFPEPVNANLPPALRSLGGFDQAMDPSDPSALQLAAVTAATALHRDLIGVTAGSPVAERAAVSGPSAIVVPLERSGPAGQQIVGLAAFLTDCTGRPFFDAVDDRSQNPLAAYPPGRPEKAGAGMQLEFADNPFEPYWH